jgi:hypothetical protein
LEKLKTGDFVFAGQARNKPLSNMAMEMVLRRMKIERRHGWDGWRRLMGFAAEAEVDAVGDVQSVRKAIRPLRGDFGLWLRCAGREIDGEIISFEINARIQVSQEISIQRNVKQKDRPKAVSLKKLGSAQLRGVRRPVVRTRLVLGVWRVH